MALLSRGTVAQSTQLIVYLHMLSDVCPRLAVLLKPGAAVAEARNSIKFLKKSLSIFSCILIWYSFIEQILFYWFQVWQQAAITNKGEHPTNFKLNPKVPAKKVLGRISFSLVKQMFQTLNWSKISNGIRPTVKAFLKMTGNSKLL